MEEIITQRFQYATITPFKNYCKIEDKEKHKLLGIKEFSVDPFQDYKITAREIVFSKPKQRKNTKYFQGKSKNPENMDEYDTIFLENAYISRDFKQDFSTLSNRTTSFETTKDRHIKKHYGNPFSEIAIHTIERSVRRHGDKITIKLYRLIKKRDVNCKFFNKTTQVNSITFNTVTGNFTILHMSNGRITKQTRFRTNSFYELQTLFQESPISPFRTRIMSSYQNIQDEFSKVFNNTYFNYGTRTALGIETSHSQNIFIFHFISLFVHLKKIKVPDTYHNLLINLYPTEKYFKKNDRKLVSSILDMVGIKSKVTIKLVHKNPEIDILSLARLCNFFGDDYQKYIGNIDERCFSKAKYGTADYNNSLMIYRHQVKTNQIGNLNLLDAQKVKNRKTTNVEKENIVKILNNKNKHVVDCVEVNDSFTQLLFDHFNMIDTISEYNPEIRLNATTYADLHEEHLELTKIVSAIRKGWTTEYQFNEKMVKDVEEPIEVEINLSDDYNNPDIVTELFYPHILKREEEYIEEGNFMHHCVATYADREKSVIISIRTKDGTDRITCEFESQTGILLQAKHFCNGLIPGDMELALDKLKLKTVRYAKYGMFHSIDKKKVHIQINGIEVKRKVEAIFPDELFPDF